MGNRGGIQQSLAGDRRHQNGWHMATHTHTHVGTAHTHHTHTLCTQAPLKYVIIAFGIMLVDRGGRIVGKWEKHADN